MLREQKALLGGTGVLGAAVIAAVTTLSGGDDALEAEKVAKAPDAVERVVAPAKPKAQPKPQPQPQPKPQTKQTAQTPADKIVAKYNGTLKDPCGHLKGGEKKSCNKEVFNAQDRVVLKDLGFTSSITINGYGRNCESDGSVTGKWKGNGTSVSYSGSLSGQMNKVCINHKGKVSKPSVGTGPVALQASAPTLESIATKYNGTMKDLCGHLKGGNKKSCNRAAMNVQDSNVLKSEGFGGSIKVNGYGRQCESDGSVTGKWKGSSSSVSYTGSINGTTHNICIEHGGKNSKVKTVTGPVRAL